MALVTISWRSVYAPFFPQAILDPTFMSGRIGIHHSCPSLRRRKAATQRGTGVKENRRLPEPMLEQHYAGASLLK